MCLFISLDFQRTSYVSIQCLQCLFRNHLILLFIQYYHVKSYQFYVSHICPSTQCWCQITRAEHCTQSRVGPAWTQVLFITRIHEYVQYVETFQGTQCIFTFWENYPNPIKCLILTCQMKHLNENMLKGPNGTGKWHFLMKCLEETRKWTTLVT